MCVLWWYSVHNNISNCPISLSIVYGKPILPTSSTSPSPIPFLQGGGAGGVKAVEDDVTDGGKGGESSDGQILPPPNVDNIPRPLSPTKLTPVGMCHRFRLLSVMNLLILLAAPNK